MAALLLLGLLTRWFIWSFPAPPKPVDPSLGPTDPALILALESALAPDAHPPAVRDAGYDIDVVMLNEGLDRAGFEAQLRTVPDWDGIVVIGPYQQGGEIDLDAADIQDEPLRRHIRSMHGWESDGVYDVAVIRANRFIGGFYLRDDAAGWGSFVVKR
jgi:hypothetical protein